MEQIGAGLGFVAVQNINWYWQSYQLLNVEIPIGLLRFLLVDVCWYPQYPKENCCSLIILHFLGLTPHVMSEGKKILQFIIIFRSFPMRSLLVSPAILLLKGQPNADDQIHFFDAWTLLFDALNHLKSPSIAPFSLMLESLCWWNPRWCLTHKIYTILPPWPYNLAFPQMISWFLACQTKAAGWTVLANLPIWNSRQRCCLVK